jgi:hypothetical protein
MSEKVTSSRSSLEKLTLLPFIMWKDFSYTEISSGLDYREHNFSNSIFKELLSSTQSTNEAPSELCTELNLQCKSQIK